MPVPAALTENVTLFPAHIICETGCVLITTLPNESETVVEVTIPHLSG